MPTNNIICEHLLATFSHHADVSKFRNLNFSAKGIKDNIVLHIANQSTIYQPTKITQMQNTKWVRIVYSKQTRYCWKKLWPHQAERNMEPTLLKSMIRHDECLENLLVLLSDNNCLATSSHASVLDLPTNTDLSKFLDCVTEDKHTRQ